MNQEFIQSDLATTDYYFVACIPCGKATTERAEWPEAIAAAKLQGYKVEDGVVYCADCSEVELERQREDAEEAARCPRCSSTQLTDHHSDGSSVRYCNGCGFAVAIPVKVDWDNPIRYLKCGVCDQNRPESEIQRTRRCLDYVYACRNCSSKVATAVRAVEERYS